MVLLQHMKLEDLHCVGTASKGKCVSYRCLKQTIGHCNMQEGRAKHPSVDISSYFPICGVET